MKEFVKKERIKRIREYIGIIYNHTYNYSKEEAEIDYNSKIIENNIEKISDEIDQLEAIINKSV